MRLQIVSLRGRRFLIQFNELMREFGDVIPWLDGLKNLQCATNDREFHRHLLRCLGGITPYQFVDNDCSRTYVGGILLFERSPENLHDARNREIADRLTRDGARYISCLQVRGEYRGRGVGRDMMRRALAAIQAKHGAVWGVVSDPRLLPWYVALGAHSPSPLDNGDNLWIVHWPNPE